MGTTISFGGNPFTVLLIVLGLVLTFLISNRIARWIDDKKYQIFQERYTRLMRNRGQRPKIPVTIITGFLGSGKTVLLNHILRNPGGRKICVIENELGAISIDHSLLVSPPPPSSSSSSFDDDGKPNGTDTRPPVLVLKNGCMCCSATGSGDELSRTLERLLSLTDNPPVSSATSTNFIATVEATSSQPISHSIPDPSSSLPFDYVIIETSGMVDPAPLVQTFYRSSLNEDAQFSLDGIITVIDSKHIHYHLQPLASPSSTSSTASFFTNTKEAQQQIAYADLLLLNKIDTVNSTEKQSTIDLIRSINPLTQIRECTYGKVPIDQLLDRSAFQVNRTVESLFMQQLQEQEGMYGNHPPSLIRTTSIVPRHSNDIIAVTLSPPSAASILPVSKLLRWLKDMVHHDWKNIYRIKGILNVYDDDADAPSDGPEMVSSSNLFAVHGVHAELQGSRIESLPDTVNSIDHSPHSHLHDDACTECATNSSHYSPLFRTALVLIGKQLDHEKYRSEFSHLYQQYGKVMSDNNTGSIAHHFREERSSANKISLTDSSSSSSSSSLSRRTIRSNAKNGTPSTATTRSTSTTTTTTRKARGTRKDKKIK